MPQTVPDASIWQLTVSSEKVQLKFVELCTESLNSSNDLSALEKRYYKKLPELSVAQGARANVDKIMPSVIGHSVATIVLS